MVFRPFKLECPNVLRVDHMFHRNASVVLATLSNLMDRYTDIQKWAHNPVTRFRLNTIYPS